MEARFYHKPFSALSTTELYDLMHLRQEIFIVEQDCPYLDADTKDQDCEHILLYVNNILVAYARVVPEGISYKNYTSIGRVVTKKTQRGTGLGQKLMQYAINVCQKLYPHKAIKISAQCYAIGFYEKLGFQSVGEEYLEDDIPHIGMVLS